MAQALCTAFTILVIFETLGNMLKLTYSGELLWAKALNISCQAYQPSTAVRHCWLLSLEYIHVSEAAAGMLSATIAELAALVLQASMSPQIGHTSSWHAFPWSPSRTLMISSV